MTVVKNHLYNHLWISLPHSTLSKRDNQY